MYCNARHNPNELMAVSGAVCYQRPFHLDLKRQGAANGDGSYLTESVGNFIY